jgi:hypothetical protein
MSKYRHAPLTVDAVQWTGQDAALQELLALGLTAYRLVRTPGDHRMTLIIAAPEGDQHVAPDWWAVRREGAETGFRSVSPDDFGDVYTPLAGDAA